MSDLNSILKSLRAKQQIEFVHQLTHERIAFEQWKAPRRNDFKDATMKVHGLKLTITRDMLIED